MYQAYNEKKGKRETIEGIELPNQERIETMGKER